MNLTDEQVKEFAAQLTEPMFTLKGQIFAVLTIMRKLHSIGVAPESPIMQELDLIDIELNGAYRQFGHVVCQMVQDDAYLTELYKRMKADKESAEK